MPDVILSTCGTSVFTNQTEKEIRDILTRYANARLPEDIDDSAVRQRIQARVDSCRRHFLETQDGERRRLSAEANGLLCHYSGSAAHGGDLHYLVCTDTWLGQSAAQVVAEWLRQSGQSAEVVRIPDLRTGDLMTFRSGMSGLIQWCEDTLAGYLEHSAYRVLFNLTGGFKGVNGFLQTLSLFYAHESFYIFEGSDQLLRLPRLPVRLDVDDLLQDHLKAFRRMGAGLAVAERQCREIPELLLVAVDGEATTTPWGDLIWRRRKSEIYGVRVYPPISDRLRFSPGFERDVAKLSRDRNVTLNERLDQLAGFLELDRNPSSLDFRALKTRNGPSSHECNAWSDRAAWRIFSHFENAILVLDELAEGLHR